MVYKYKGTKNIPLLQLLKQLSYIELTLKGGFCLIHGFGTVINSNSHIGKNCIVLHGVTIGEDWKGGTPVIGDDVFIGCSATIIGKVHIGNRVKIGAGAIVVDDIPDDATVISPKATIKQYRK